MGFAHLLFSRFNLKNSNVNDSNLDSVPEANRPDVIIIKKVYGDKASRNRRRKWKLKHIDGLHDAKDTSSQANDYEEFLQVCIWI